MGRRRLFFNKSYLGFAVESDIAEKFKAKCRELNVDYSQVLREFVHSFILAEPKEERKIITFNIDLKVEQVIKQEEKERKLALQYVRELELQEFKEKLNIWRQTASKTRNSMDLYDIKRAIVSWLKKLKDIDEETLNEAKSIVELCEKRLEQLRRL